MSAHRIKILRRFAHLQLGKVTAAVFLTVSVGLLTLQTGGHAQVPNPLPYTGGYLVTGNYVVGGVDLTDDLNPSDPVTGLSTGSIQISGVPTDATIVGAYLYWETITLQADPSQATAKFRGYDLPLDDEVAVRRISLDLVGSAATCWSSGTPLTMHHFKADVLRYFDVRLDKDNNETGKRIVNGAHEIQLPTRSGNQVPESAGATLVIVYVDPSEPLRKIVFYDGRYRQPDLNTPMVQTLQGFYKSALTNKSAKLTHIVASGQPNNKDRIFFNDGPTTGQPGYDATNGYQQATDPVFGGTSSQRGWSQNTVLDPSLYRDVTYNVSNFMNPGNVSYPGNPPPGNYGETATTTLDHTQGGSYDCLVWGAIIFSTAVDDDEVNQDTSQFPGDGIPDGLEEASAAGGLLDPDGKPLPDLRNMGATDAQRDLFIEINAMRTLASKVHGSTSAPYGGAGTSPATVSVPPHTHMPTPEVLKLIGDAYVAHGITPHFDVGNIQAYKNHGNFYDTLDGNPVADGVISHTNWVDDYDSDVADAYLVSSDPKGGELIDEHSCLNPIIPTCQFPDFPGTVGWKLGLQLVRDWPVGVNGEELITPAELEAWKLGPDYRHRFDRKRFGLFHYMLYAHYRGLAKSEFPCLTAGNPGTPTGTDLDTGTCSGSLKDNPDFYVPSSSGGFADRPGGNAMVTMGRWDEYVGKPFSRAATSFHELGHNLNLSHGGILPSLGDKAQNTPTIVEPNCKPNYLSSMSYLFQIHGLLDDEDNLHLDYSNAQHSNISESATIGDGSLPGALYRPAWYAPYPSTLATSLGVSKATRYCNGLRFPALNEPSMARVYVDSAGDPIDWQGDDPSGSNASAFQQDVNFDSGVTALMKGFNDWQNIRLNQIMSGRKVGRVIGESSDWSGDGSDWLGDGSDWTGDGSDWLGDGSDWLGDGSDWLGDGSDWTGDGSDWLGDGSDWSGDGSVPFELDFEAAKGLGRSAPSALKTCIIGGTNPACSSALPFDPLYHKNEARFQGSTFDQASYHVERKRGDATSTYPWAEVGTTPTLIFKDSAHLPDTVFFTYKARGEFNNPSAFSGYSKTIATATIAAVNEPPVANADTYSIRRNRDLKVPTNLGVLANDTDVDSPLASKSSWRAVLVPNSGPFHGTLIFNADGSFTYSPASAYTGPDSFQYRANNGVWSVDPTVPMNTVDSNIATVSITVTER